MNEKEKEDFQDAMAYYKHNRGHTNTEGNWVKGRWETNEAQKQNPRPVELTEEDFIELYLGNGGSISRCFGVKKVIDRLFAPLFRK